MIAKLTLPLFLPALPRLRLAALFAWRRQPRHQRVAADELRAMSESELKDLGIGRCEIEWQLSQGRSEKR